MTANAQPSVEQGIQTSILAVLWFCWNADVDEFDICFDFGRAGGYRGDKLALMRSDPGTFFVDLDVENQRKLIRTAFAKYHGTRGMLDLPILTEEPT